MIVVDSSALIRALTDDRDLGNKARGVMSMHEEWAAPMHLTAEFGHGLRGMVLGGKIELSRAEAALEEYFEIGLDLHSASAASTRRAWQLRHNLSYCDALYVELAERLGYALLTADARIEAAGSARCEIIAIRPDQ